jgi:hypothetical protein
MLTTVACTKDCIIGFVDRLTYITPTACYDDPTFSSHWGSI